LSLNDFNDFGIKSTPYNQDLNQTAFNQLLHHAG
jgi:hypothetical protein